MSKLTATPLFVVMEANPDHDLSCTGIFMSLDEARATVAKEFYERHDGEAAQYRSVNGEATVIEPDGDEDLVFRLLRAPGPAADELPIKEDENDEQPEIWYEADSNGDDWGTGFFLLIQRQFLS